MLRRFLPLLGLLLWLLQSLHMIAHISLHSRQECRLVLDDLVRCDLLHLLQVFEHSLGRLCGALSQLWWQFGLLQGYCGFGRA